MLRKFRVPLFLGLLLVTGAFSSFAAGVPKSHKGAIESIFQSNGYTYVKYKEKTSKWVAFLEDQRVQKGDVIEFLVSPPLIDFESKSLGMKFKRIEFAPGIQLYRKGRLLPPAKTEADDSDSIDNKSIKEISFRQFRQYLISLSQNDEALSKSNPYSPGSPQFNIYLKFQKTLLADQEFLKPLYDVVRENDDNISNYTVFIKAFISQHAKRGLLRLEEKDLTEFMRLVGKIMELIPPDDCAKLIRGQNNINFQWLVNLNPKDAESYLTISMRALLASVRSLPEIPQNTNTESKTAWDGLREQLVNDLSTAELKLFATVSQNLEVETDDNACWAGQVMFNGILAMQGEKKRLIIREYANILRNL